MMRHTIFLLHVLFVSTLCSCIFGLPVDNKGNKDGAASAQVGEVEVCFYKEDGLEAAGSREADNTKAFMDAVEKALLEGLSGTTNVIFKNGWEPPKLPDDKRLAAPGRTTLYDKTQRAFATVTGPKCPHGCLAWFSSPHKGGKPNPKEPISKRRLYWEVLSQPAEADSQHGLTSVARSKDWPLTGKYFIQSGKVFMDKFQLAQKWGEHPSQGTEKRLRKGSEGSEKGTNIKRPKPANQGSLFVEDSDTTAYEDSADEYYLPIRSPSLK
ncbi:hypothetical protein BDP27DRAFT_1359624 [Rhodocollybia butyracea]|uniref:Uncharacterized protein n=1 Tax=Rhodocollybia butyracea TaxID=206335 RepID=A0A9P5PX28_9AGAR|nr:hypothetical protein BDP27DRAFT_1359624 [Rhodocollybia butyracea]